jgi:hypothetical protein
MDEYDIIGPGDQAALLAISTPEVMSAVKTALAEMGYKVHEVENHDQFDVRYHQFNYHVVVIEENFAVGDSMVNYALRMIQELPMSQRRHATFFLIGPNMETLNTMQAFTQSVHCVINYAELPMLSDLVQKTVAENDMFLSTFREVQRRVYQRSA